VVSLGPFELLVIVAVLLLVVGPTVLPRITRNLGKSVGSFKQGLSDGDKRDVVEGRLERTAEGDELPPPKLQDAEESARRRRDEDDA
jgi:sec-independent protein translocase protein TatA